ncbi:phosphoadenylylsulfate reductase (thioredoxin) [Psychromonas ingrahamii 37]|uniref:Phosphoadenosine 5'-phosphosulfate reductase n=1 Tax=Psychromonas ingrahamii (strain DSM 17664 / CCUG 51855 / 37) TaxID=357804 RepID=A1T055_PSYIN|nr:phosphoadenylyl-sulfate reductase [Psychromonas ingrahamii]ABM05120.1 phosphoadenylylsulfate reductase (thioredoxin) [Psychromonas ingrahamii 37]
MTNRLNLTQLLSLDKAQQTEALQEANDLLENKTARERVEWAIEHLESEFVLSSSFGIQAAVCLHLITQVKADTPIILTDTGYLFPETYRFIDALTEKLNLNLKTYRAEHSSAWQEARYGKLWEQGVDGLTQYNLINKVEPMKRALKDLNAKTWFSGLRRSQASSRGKLPVLSIQNGCFKFLPIIDWSNKDVHYYLSDHGLEYHPLWEQGYVSVGDVQTSQPLGAGMSEEETRFFGLKRECGLHEDDVEEQGSGI